MKVNSETRIKFDIYVFITELTVTTHWYDLKDAITLYIGYQIYTRRNLSERSVFSGIRVTGSLVLRAMFYRLLFVFLLLVIVLSVPLRFTDYDYHFGIFKLCLPKTEII